MFIRIIRIIVFILFFTASVNVIYNWNESRTLPGGITEYFDFEAIQNRSLALLNELIME